MDNGASATGTKGVGGFFLGLLVGSLAMGIAVWLYAPKPGQETRARLKAEVAESQDMLQRWANEAQERVNHFAEIIRTSVKPEVRIPGDGQRTPG